MASNMDFTDKTQETLGAAIQIAKDYANSQGTSRFTTFRFEFGTMFEYELRKVAFTKR